MRVLHIIASPREDRSRSRAIADHFLAQLATAEIAVLDLWAQPLPDLDGRMLESRYCLINGEPVDAAFEVQWAELRARVDHLLSFDLWLFSTPMWNLGLPYRLKHFLDLIIQPTMAFTNDASGAISCHGVDKVAVLIGASALDIRPEAPLAGLDFQLAHLAQCLKLYFGLSRVHELRIAPTFGSDAVVAQAVGTARAAAEALALNLAPPDGGRD